MFPEERINATSKTPKYKQVINTILADIEQGILKYGEKIPSINETAESYYLSRDTVEKAYNELRSRGIITSVRGKGYYVASLETSFKLKVFLLLNKLSAHKKTVYYSFIEALGERATVDLHIYHYNIDTFKTLIENNLGDYHFYVIMPHFKNKDEGLLDVINHIPREQLIVLDKDIDGIRGDYTAVYQDFERDIFQALQQGEDLFKKYKKVKLVFPKTTIHPAEIVKGFIIFSKVSELEYKVIDSMEAESIHPGEAYVVIEETDLVDLIKKCREQNLVIGKDVGIVSYNETPVKEVLADGITVISTDFAEMGRKAAELVLDKRNEKIRNPFKFIRRNSL
ncbi:MAG: GntR family transcriptional regulator [Candidatus Cyclobacteriaceae bacterium M3_2C_046]